MSASANARYNNLAYTRDSQPRHFYRQQQQCHGHAAVNPRFNPRFNA